MSKLYPPVIEGIIPAFYENKITIPFFMNKAVSPYEINGFSLKIKTVQSNYYLGNPMVYWTKDQDGKDILEGGTYEINNENGTVTFILPEENIKSKLNIGQYYKIQLAYLDHDGIPGFYSTVGVVKYTTKPSVEILDTTDGTTFIGRYSQGAENSDVTEKVYSYRFDLKNSDGVIIESSGEQLHNSSFDTDNSESIDSFSLTTSLEEGKMYYLDYQVKTINGLVEPKNPNSKRLIKTESIDSNLKADIKVTLNYEDGCASLDLIGHKDENGVEYSAVGQFILLRSSDEDNFSTWNEVLKFLLYGQQPSRHLWDDMTVKQGVTYKYAIQQYNYYKLRSNKIESESVYIDFEHAYLYDGQRQLKIKYNPKVSSFKNTLLENKIDTIGNKYPFIFRNGNVKYKEFPISGLISYLSDENHFFYETNHLDTDIERGDNKHSLQTLVEKGPITKKLYDANYLTYYVEDSYQYVGKDEDGKDKVLTKYHKISWREYLNKYYPTKDILDYDQVSTIITKVFNDRILYEIKRQQEYQQYENAKMNTTNLVSYNICTERNFKLDVLEWLTNGKPKLFRSPGEGNYIVRLLNVSLSPQDPLGRMLHTFNCTAYEIADYTYQNLEKFNLITTDDPTTAQLRWETLELNKIEIADDDNILNYGPAVAIRFEGMVPGDKIWIDDGVTRTGEQQSGYSIVIGVTGSYVIDLDNNVSISKISFQGSPEYLKKEDGTVRHQGILTYAYYSTKFTDSFDSVNQIKTVSIPCQQFIGSHNIFEEIENIKDKIQSITSLRFYLRSTQPVYQNDELSLYADTNFSEMINPQDEINILNIYSLKETVVNNSNSLNYRNIYQGMYETDKYYLDLYETKEIDISTVMAKRDNYKIWQHTNWYDGYNNILLGENYDSTWTKIYFNDDYEMDLIDTEEYRVVTPPKDIKSIKIGPSLICEIAYQKKIISYELEDKGETAVLKQNYTDAHNALMTLISESDASRDVIKLQQQQCALLYNEFLKSLEATIEESERR